MTGDLVGKVVIAFTRDGEAHCAGVAEGYFDGPTYVISGKAWLAELTREATPEEQIEYWRARAERAERAAAADRSLSQPLGRS